MKLLWDESGNVLVWTGPYPATTPAKAENLPKRAVPVVIPIAKAADVPHCCFHCANCGESILLSHPGMGLPFASPRIRRIEVRTIASVCPGCHHLNNYSLFRGAPGFDTRHKLMPAPLEVKTGLMDWLQCSIEGCPFKVPVFISYTGENPPEQDRSRWIWNELTCMSGHRIRRPRPA